MGRRLNWGRTAAALAVAAASVVAAPASGAGCPARVALPDDWTRISAPEFGAGSETMTTYDAADASVGHLVATNGAAIAATDDDGCHWTEATLPEPIVPDLPIGEARIVGEAITQVRYAGFSSKVVWAIGQADIAVHNTATTRPRVLLSADGGRTFALRAGNLPQFGRPVAIRGFGAFAVLLFRESIPSEKNSVYVTDDAGTTWRQLSSGPALTDVALDPATSTLWLWSSGGLYVSRGGAAPVPVGDVNGAIKTVDVSGGIVTAFLSAGTERFVSTDGGTTFAVKPSPDRVQSASGHAMLPGLLAISSVEQNALIELPASLGRPPVDFSPRDANVNDLQFVQTVTGSGFPLYAFNPGALYARMVPLDFAAPPPPPPEPPVEVRRHTRRRVRQVSEIAPVKPVIRLRPGQSRTVPFRVDLAPVPTPLDVYFMTDSTGSMKNTIYSVQSAVQDIVEELKWYGINVQFGVADFRDYPDRGAGSNTTNYAYKQRRAIGPVDDELTEALEGITTGGGSTDGHDAGLEAIYQAVTGAGRVDPLGVDGQLIPPGLDAGFRPEAMKVVLVATDDNFRHPIPGYPGPSVDTVSEALVASGAYLVGIAVDTDSGSARPDMERLAGDTGAVAPPSGIDCDDDGVVDIPRGGPIVCDFDPTAGDNVAGAFISMLSGIRDVAAIDLAITGPKKLVRAAGQTTFPKVNVKAENSFTLPVRFTCPKEEGSSETAVRIGARSRGAEVVGTTATLQCVAPQPAQPAIPPPLRAVVAAALVPPPPPPPAPVTNVQPNPNPNPNPNPQLNANAGFAAQEDQEFQLALADNDVTGEDLAMTGLDRSGPPLPAVAWAAACAMTAAAAYGLHLRRRACPAPAFNPREHR